MNETLIQLAVALIPVAILLFYIYRKDKLCPEPAGQLIKAFVFGIVSAFASFALSIPFGWLGLYPSENLTAIDGVKTAFFGAAIPEEVAKFAMLWLLLRRNRFFDEKMDGIVYAVFVSLGFAALENVLYIIGNSDDFLRVGFSRALFAIPGHFCFGVLMGYYYSLAKFYPKASLKNKLFVLLAPIVVHGLYDSILFVMDVNPYLNIVLFIFFLFFCRKMWKIGTKKIKTHLERDME